MRVRELSKHKLVEGEPLKAELFFNFFFFKANILTAYELETMANLRLNTSSPNPDAHSPLLCLHTCIQVEVINGAHRERMPISCFRPQDDFCLEHHSFSPAPTHTRPCSSVNCLARDLEKSQSYSCFWSHLPLQ